MQLQTHNNRHTGSSNIYKYCTFISIQNFTFPSWSAHSSNWASVKFANYGFCFFTSLGCRRIIRACSSIWACVGMGGFFVSVVRFLPFCPELELLELELLGVESELLLACVVEVERSVSISAVLTCSCTSLINASFSTICSICSNTVFLFICPKLPAFALTRFFSCLIESDWKEPWNSPSIFPRAAFLQAALWIDKWATWHSLEQ